MRSPQAGVKESSFIVKPRPFKAASPLSATQFEGTISPSQPTTKHHDVTGGVTSLISLLLFQLNLPLIVLIYSAKVAGLSHDLTRVTRPFFYKALPICNINLLISYLILHFTRLNVSYIPSKSCFGIRNESGLIWQILISQSLRYDGHKTKV